MKSFRMFKCKIHGEVRAIVTDELLLRYACSDCEMEKKNDSNEDKVPPVSEK